MTFGVVVCVPVSIEKMSDLFPCGSWLYHSVHDGQWGIRYSISRSVARRIRAGHVLALGTFIQTHRCGILFILEWF